MLERSTFFHVTVHVYRKGNVYNFRTLQTTLHVFAEDMCLTSNPDPF